MNARADTAVPGASLLRRLSLRTNFKWTLVGNAIHFAAQWGILIVLAKLGSVEAVGQFTLGLAIAYPVMAATTLHLRQVQVTDARGEFDVADYFGVRIITTIATLIIVLGILLIAGYESSTFWVVIWVTLAKAFESVSEILRGHFQRHERMDLSGISMMIRGPAGLAAVLAGLLLTGDPVLAIAMRAVAWLLVFLVYDLPLAHWMLRLRERVEGIPYRLRPNLSWHMFAGIGWLAAPAGLGQFLAMLAMSVPRYFVEAWHGEAALGFLGAISAVTIGSSVFVRSLGQSSSPRLAIYFISDTNAFKRLLFKLLKIGLALGALLVTGVALAGRPFLTIAYTSEYAAYYPEFVLYGLASGIGYVTMFGTTALQSARAFRAYAAVYALDLVAVTLLAIVLVPAYGVRGAAVASVCAVVLRGLVLLATLTRVIAKHKIEPQAPAPAPAEVLNPPVTLEPK